MLIFGGVKLWRLVASLSSGKYRPLKLNCPTERKATFTSQAPPTFSSGRWLLGALLVLFLSGRLFKKKSFHSVNRMIHFQVTNLATFLLCRLKQQPKDGKYILPVMSFWLKVLIFHGFWTKETLHHLECIFTSGQKNSGINMDKLCTNLKWFRGMSHHLAGHPVATPNAH